MRVVVTGGAGFIGSHLSRKLLDSGDEVTILDDLSTGLRENVPDGSTLAVASVTDRKAVAAVTQGADVIYHLAAVVSVLQCQRNPRHAWDVNVNGTLNVLEAARQGDTPRIVLASTCAVYGNEPTLPKRESMATAPTGPYAASKTAAEAMCQAWHETYDIATTALRLFNVYGPGQDPASPYAAVIPRFVSDACQGRPLTIFGDGEQTRDFVNVGDIVEVFRLVPGCQATAGRILNVCTATETTINDLARAVADAAGTTFAPSYKPPRPGEVYRSVGDPAALRALTSWTPKTTLANGVVAMVDEARPVGSRAG